MLGIDPRVWYALALTSLGAAGTFIGGLLVVCSPKFNFKQLGYLQGLAGGLMLSISFFDLVPESVEAVGDAKATFWFFAGVAFFAVIVWCIPLPEGSGMLPDDDQDAMQGAHATHATDPDSQRPAGRENGSSTMRYRSRHKSARQSDESEEGEAPSRLQGAHAHVSHSHQGHHAEPFSHIGDPGERREARRKVLISGLITALGIALHNFPEGVAVFLASIKSQSIGVSLAVAIAMHNIPEGVAVALPVYFATGSRLKGLYYAFISGLAEPLAVIIMGIVFRAFWLDKMVIDCLLAAVGGIMAFLSLHELLPLAMEHAGRQAAVMSLFFGMAIMSLNLQLLANWMGDAH